MKELQVMESKRNAIRKGLAFELFNAQDSPALGGLQIP
jgi:hypothetical protein